MRRPAPRSIGQRGLSTGRGAGRRRRRTLDADFASALRARIATFQALGTRTHLAADADAAPAGLVGAVGIAQAAIADHDLDDVGFTGARCHTAAAIDEALVLAETACGQGSRRARVASVVGVGRGELRPFLGRRGLEAGRRLRASHDGRLAPGRSALVRWRLGYRRGSATASKPQRHHRHPPASHGARIAQRCDAAPAAASFVNRINFPSREQYRPLADTAGRPAVRAGSGRGLHYSGNGRK